MDVGDYYALYFAASVTPPSISGPRKATLAHSGNSIQLLRLVLR